jgi:hypothetical protein
MGFSLINILALVKCTYHIYSMLLKRFYFFTTHKSCQYRLCKECHVYLTYLMLQQQLNYLNGMLDGRIRMVVCLITA